MPDVQRPNRPGTVLPNLPKLPDVNAQGYRPGGSPSGGGSSCFPRGTMIDTPHGARDIAEISTGDAVLSFCRRCGRVREREVIKVVRHAESAIWVLRLDDRSIRTTRTHSFLTESGWRRAGQLRSGMTIRLHNSQAATITASGEVSETEPVYNLIVEGDFTYIADGAVAHSFSYLRSFRMLMWSTMFNVLRHARLRRGIAPVLDT